MDAILKNNFQNILAGYQKVADYTVSGSAITSYDFTDLNIGKEDDYMLVSDIKNAGSASEYSVYANANYTSSNYYFQNIYFGSTYITATRLNNSIFCYADVSTIVIHKIKLTNNGYFVDQTTSNRYYGTSNLQGTQQYITSTFTATSITSLRIASVVSTQIGIGSRFQLYKRVAPIVADITVSTATTSVDITGLSIDKGSEYMLVSDFNNTSASTSSMSVYANGNTTVTNYYTQRLRSSSAAVESYRYNANYIGDVSASLKNIAIANIKLTNNLYYVVQNNSTRSYGSSAIEIINDYSTSTFTATSITKLTITASVSNGIGIGSRFQLIKLK